MPQSSLCEIREAQSQTSGVFVSSRSRGCFLYQIASLISCKRIMRDPRHSYRHIPRTVDCSHCILGWLSGKSHDKAARERKGKMYGCGGPGVVVPWKLLVKEVLSTSHMLRLVDCQVEVELRIRYHGWNA